MPGKKMEEMGLIDVSAAKKPASASIPVPPPPPPVVQQKSSFLPSADQKLEMPSFTFPNFDGPKTTATTSAASIKPASAVAPPRPQQPPIMMEVPKLSFPKVSMPEFPKASSIPEPPKAEKKKAEPAAKPPPPAVKKEEKKKDNYVFTESALMEFIAKDKPAVTELDRQQEEERRAREKRDAEIRRASDAATSAFKGASAPAATKARPTTTKAAAAPREKTPESVPPVKGRPTFSLFGLGGSETTPIADATAASPKAATPTTSAVVAPRGVPTISMWKIDAADNSISGLISGSGSFEDGEPVTTSPIVGEAAPNSVVRTKSGSRYFLGEEDSSKSGGMFGFFGGGGVGVESKPAVAPAPTPLIFPAAPSSSAAEIAAEKKRKADDIAAERRRVAEETAAARKKADEKSAEGKRIAEATAAAKKAAEVAAAAKREARAKSLREAEEKRRIAADGKFVWC
jgi:hypothetical protein